MKKFTIIDSIPAQERRDAVRKTSKELKQFFKKDEIILCLETYDYYMTQFPHIMQLLLEHDMRFVQLTYIDKQENLIIYTILYYKTDIVYSLPYSVQIDSIVMRKKQKKDEFIPYLSRVLRHIEIMKMGRALDMVEQIFN